MKSIVVFFIGNNERNIHFMITLTINGDSHSTPKAMTLTELLVSLELTPKKVAVERNMEIVPKSQFDNVVLENNDSLEIVHFIGGG